MTPASRDALRTPLEAATLARVAWLVGMRWAFVAGLVLCAVAGRMLLPDLPVLPFLLLALLTGAYNTLAHFLNSRVAALPDERKQALVHALIQGQIIADWLVLLAVVHYSGGIESPLLQVFVFHVVLSAVFLRPRFTVFALLFITVALNLLFAAEATGLLQPVVLRGLSNPERQHSWLHILHFSLWHALTLAVMALLLGAVMRGLRRREAEALRMRHRLEQANRDILRISEERVRLMRTMGHELRSPIAAAQSMLSALELSQGPALPEAVRGIHHRISQRLLGLTALISELLELAEQRGSAAGQAVLRRVDLPPMLDALLADQMDRAREAGLVLVGDWDGQAAHLAGADPLRLQRVCENLVSNAIKYSRPGGTVSVSLAAVEWDGAPWVEIRVRDEGIGIAPDQLPRLFTEFYRTPQSRRHTTQGTGLGLAITRELVESMGGTLGVESVLDKGSTFILRLPRLS